VRFVSIANRCRTWVLPALMLLTSQLCFAGASVLRLGYSDVETFPYQMGNGVEIAEPPGLAVELIRQAAEETGITVQFQRMPNKRVIFALKAGQIDGAFIFSHNDERASFASYPLQNGKLDVNRRLARLAYHLYRMPNNPVHWDGSKLTHLQLKVGANTGYSIVDDLLKLGVPVEEARNTEQNFEKLKLGRISAVAAQDEMADPYLLKVGMTQVEKLPKPLVAKDYYLIFAQSFFEKNGPIVEKLWDKIGEIRERKSRELLPKYPLP
jgi:polar amino acid transport system substrate-binding protein